MSPRVRIISSAVVDEFPDSETLNDTFRDLFAEGFVTLGTAAFGEEPSVKVWPELTLGSG